ncbi:hypothetical protein [Bifidobacterium myosotis]|uniref:Uncharacterized protein n=1 Tax=Bifidobacterium myosotis TaxID=1630166 RepID=A0A5M9ZKN2_9BIFI|nr:hypothetical protein [Bifidobacterium myosotis]KAA8828151.1 hypothetical protein EMO91_06840 [Bifidobacterium myosotis]
MTPAEAERFEHAILDRFAYADRMDDGYGPDHPRIGDTGVLCHGADAVGFTVGLEPRTRLPALRLDDGRWLGLMDAMSDPHTDPILHRREPGSARIVTLTGGRTGALLDPPWEGAALVAYGHGRLHDAETLRPLDGTDGLDPEESLERLGYRLEEP